MLKLQSAFLCAVSKFLLPMHAYTFICIYIQLLTDCLHESGKAPAHLLRTNTQKRLIISLEDKRIRKKSGPSSFFCFLKSKKWKMDMYIKTTFWKHKHNQFFIIILRVKSFEKSAFHMHSANIRDCICIESIDTQNIQHTQ